MILDKILPINAPRITIVLTVHMKPTLAESLAALVGQDYDNWECLVVDSGAWQYQAGEIADALSATYYQYKDHPNIVWCFTQEGRHLRQEKCPVSWAFNEVVRNGWVRGDYFCTYYDDDIYYPEFLSQMIGYIDMHPGCQGVRCSEARTMIYKDGHQESTPPLEALEEIVGPFMDCRVDGMQVMLKTSILDLIADPWLPEDPDISSCSHSDGIFLNKVGMVIDKLHALPLMLCEHRSTQWSTYTPTD